MGSVEWERLDRRIAGQSGNSIRANCRSIVVAHLLANKDVSCIAAKSPRLLLPLISPDSVLSFLMLSPTCWFAGIGPRPAHSRRRTPIGHDESNVVDAETRHCALRDVIVFGQQVAACRVVGDCDRDCSSTPLHLTSWGEPVQKCGLGNLGPDLCLGCHPFAVWVFFRLLVGQPVSRSQTLPARHQAYRRRICLPRQIPCLGKPVR